MQGFRCWVETGVDGGFGYKGLEEEGAVCVVGEEVAGFEGF